MEIRPGEKSIFGYFEESGQAQRAKKKLENLGYSKVQVDRVSRYGTDFNSEYNNPVAGQAETQTGLTLYSTNQDRFSNTDSRALKNADPSVYSMANYDYGIAGGKAFLLVAVVNDQDTDTVVDIIKSEGGSV